MNEFTVSNAGHCTPSASTGAGNQAPEAATLSSSADRRPGSELAAREAMARDLTSWGQGLILMGFAHIVFASFLDPVWGVIIIFLGALTRAIKTPGMFIVIALELWFAAFINITAGDFGFWTAYGILQIFWGLQQ